MKFAWIDLRLAPAEHRAAIVDAALHARLDGVVDSTMDVLATLPPTIRRVLIHDPRRPNDASGEQPPDLVAYPVTRDEDLAALRAEKKDDLEVAAYVEVADEQGLTLACAAAVALPHTVVKFRDPTKIPLEIVIAAADRSAGRLICEVASIEEAEIALKVLEKGSEGVLLAPHNADEVFQLAALLEARTEPLELSVLIVDSIEHSGLGDRICVDTCTQFEPDEGILVGSFAHGFILCVSETHPLPYMPTRPFRVNAGALHSYTYGVDNRTNYLSELQAGATVLGVAADGRTRRIVVGRVKLESRPLLTIRAHSADGLSICLTVQDDWHVRVLGPGAAVRNVTELKAGDELLGYLADDKRHVGWPVAEFCMER